MSTISTRLQRILPTVASIAVGVLPVLALISYVSGNVVPAALAILTFASIDGGGYFAHLEKWPFDDPVVLKKLYLSLAVVAAFQVLFFFLLYSWLM